MIKILIVDDHKIVRAGLKHLLSDEEDVGIVGEAENGLDALRIARELSPDVILLDINMPNLSGLEVAKRLSKRLPKTKILAITACAHDLLSSRMINAGASGYLVKNTTKAELLDAIKTIHRGKTYISPDIAKQLVFKKISEKTNTPFDKLTAHELEIVLMIIRGHKTKDIAKILSLSPKTISSYHQKIYTKLNVKSDVAITLMALKYDLLKEVEH